MSKIILSCRFQVSAIGEISSNSYILFYNTRLPPRGTVREMRDTLAYAKESSFAEKYGDATDFAVMITGFLRRSGLLPRTQSKWFHCLGLASPIKVPRIEAEKVLLKEG